MIHEKLALIGNPNIGKSSLFNQLTGLRQKVGNYPGITVDKKTGIFQHQEIHYKLYDLPGTYNLYPNSQDEEIAYELLVNTQHKDHPDKVIVVADATHLKRSLQLFEQVLELGLPTLLVINLIDEAERKGIKINTAKLKEYYQTEVVLTNARLGVGMGELKDHLQKCTARPGGLLKIPGEYMLPVEEVKDQLNTNTNYIAWHLLAMTESVFLTAAEKKVLNAVRTQHKLVAKRLQVKEFLLRNEHIEKILDAAVQHELQADKSITPKLDKWAMHPVWGYVIFALILFLLFQSIFTLSQWPMQWIEMGFMHLSAWCRSILPGGPVQDLIADGIIPGIGGILIFVPQIGILFLGILILEETGYMSRVVFLMDRWMRPFGLNGKSIVPLISGAACAIPAVMSARNIEHKKEKLITILVTPFMTCSARLPVYSLIIGLVIADQKILFFNAKGLVLLGMYLLGVAGALLGGLLLRGLLKDRYQSYLIMEIPSYRMPLWKNVFVSLWEKITAFVFGAGKIILAISIILWVLSSFGPGEDFRNAEKVVEMENNSYVSSENTAFAKAYKLEHSYLGIIGKWFEPAIQPLGYDWKTGIGIISSFAAREVFVPTMATIYSISDNDNHTLLQDKMKKEMNQATGKPVYNFASGMSLLLFYAFAMMCMSTFAAVKRETKSWKWPVVQLVFMTALAYIVSLFTYQILR
jgi:ferrous iron transport protein B